MPLLALTISTLTERTAVQVPPAKQVHVWTDCHGSLASVELAKLVSQDPRLYVLVTANTESATDARNELAFFDASLRILSFPDYETLPYDSFSPQADIVAERLTTLAELANLPTGVLIVPVTALVQRLPPRDYVTTRTFQLAVGDKLQLAEYQRQLTEGGYRKVDTVFEHGEFATRGSILDLFPVGTDRPLRVDLFDDVVESLRIFDQETQRTIERTERVQILPAHEYPLDDRGIAQFRTSWNLNFPPDHWQCPTYQDISDGISVEGIECYLPLFFEHTNSLLEYLPDNSVVVLDSDVESAATLFFDEVQERFEVHKDDLERPLLKPFDIYYRLDEVRHLWNRFSRIRFHKGSGPTKHAISLQGNELPDITLDVRRRDPARRFREFIHNISMPVLLTAETTGRLQHLHEVLGRARIFPKEVDSYQDFLDSQLTVASTLGSLSRGLWNHQHVLITESQILGSRLENERNRAKQRSVDPESVIRDLTELHPGAPVVHLDHGVGRYVGLETLSIRSQLMEFVTLEYADGDKLYVPVSSLNLISRYTGADDENAPLHKLGSDAWSKAKTRAAQRIYDVAAELLGIYARREASRSVVVPDVNEDYRSFCDQCDFELTVDQSIATEAILEDLSKVKSTDRLVCGDVGFGKTEVAMRAAFHVVQSGFQVVVLVPTTILAQQHFDTFADRFADWPVIVDLMSRFRSAREVALIEQRVDERKVDILIGTHKVLHANVDFSKLGLLIVDEEHRFGVRDKERLRNLRAEVNTISLTATPIPRTLNMSMGGLRDLSIIATPPAKRLSVKTFVVPYSRTVVRDAIKRELARGGQVFYLHNDVRSMSELYDGLAGMVPEARLGIGHGQMPKRELEHVMADFYHRRCNVLICSTIIESGLDIPNANTIIIERADKFGLAQLHQLRGRVGRSARQAYAYLLTPEESAMTVDARKRLDAIESADELGSGFTLAVHDLEIRGAGELLGREQSGQLETIGFTLYISMLKRAVETLKSGTIPNFDDPMPMVHEVNLNVSALIPDTYLPDIHGRLVTYKRIAAAESQSELDELKVELIDRCGPLPDLANNLFQLTAVKLRAQELGISKIVLNADGGRIEFLNQDCIAPAAIATLLQSNESKLQFTQDQAIRVLHSPKEPEDRFEFAEQLIDELQTSASAVSRA